jgi:hypothetical protein
MGLGCLSMAGPLRVQFPGALYHKGVSLVSLTIVPFMPVPQMRQVWSIGVLTKGVKRVACGGLFKAKTARRGFPSHLFSLLCA